MEFFSQQLTQWISRYRPVAGTLVPDVHAGRSLGAASGNLGDVFPFTAPNALTGLLAGLSVSGFDPSVERVRLLEYRNKIGFPPTESGPCSGTRWQNMTSEDWSKVDPTADPVTNNIPATVHDVDLRFALDATDQKIHWTGTWHYHHRSLSRLYRLHWWQHPDGLFVTAVTFAAVSEHTAPFLRPCHATTSNAVVDPVCLFPLRRSVKLFGGLTVLSEGADIRLAVSTVPESLDETQTVKPACTTVLLSKSTPARAAAIRTLNGIPPNRAGHFSLLSTGTHRIARQYEELDAVTGCVRLSPGRLFILSRDTPCCSCDDYVATYETLRELFTHQEGVIVQYNTVYDLLKTYRNALKEKLYDAAKLVRVRHEKLVSADPGGHGAVRCELVVVYSNVFETEYEHKPVTIRLVSKTGQATIQHVRLRERPQEEEFHIVRSSTTTIEMTALATPPLSRKAVRLEVTLLPGGTGEEFSFTVLEAV